MYANGKPFFRQIEQDVVFKEEKDKTRGKWGMTENRRFGKKMPVRRYLFVNSCVLFPDVIDGLPMAESIRCRFASVLSCQDDYSFYMCFLSETREHRARKIPRPSRKGTRDFYCLFEGLLESYSQFGPLCHGLSGVADMVAVTYRVGGHFEVVFLKSLVWYGSYGKNQSVGVYGKDGTSVGDFHLMACDPEKR